MPVPVVIQAERHRGRTAVVDGAACWSYDQLLTGSERGAVALLAGRADLEQRRVAFLVPSDFTYPWVQWAIWRAGGVAVPLCLAHPEPELAYVVEDADADALVVHPSLHERLAGIASAQGRRLLSTEQLGASGLPGGDVVAALPEVEAGRRAQIIYTSGTTSRPKGVVTTHANMRAQIVSLVDAWSWSPDDRIVLVLPLHHVHGIVNVLGCALWAGAVCEMPGRFDAVAVWDRLAGGEVTVFMAVPTVYRRLIATWREAPETARRRWAEGASRLRLMVSGSAALPVGVLDTWREITDHTLLERYGMTEIGMALGNPLDGERRPGSVGLPLPGVEVRLVDEAGGTVEDGQSGEIEVRGPAVFGEYWRRPQETAAAFRDGWFRSGDVAVIEAGRYRILGRQSVDIIKTGGYKVSALEIEEVLRLHPAIEECAVVGVADEEWGERVAVAVIPTPQAALDLDGLRRWGKERLATYKIPSRLRQVEALPRNVLGKVVKPEVAKLFE